MLDADAAIEKVADDVRRAQTRAERMPQLQAAAAAVRGRAISRQRDIAVVVSQTGQITELRIHDQALERGGSRLAADLIQLVDQARVDLQRQMLDVAVDLLGEDDPLVETYRDAVAPDDGTDDLSSAVGLR
jgi:hypothetical protein